MHLSSFSSIFNYMLT